MKGLDSDSPTRNINNAWQVDYPHRGAVIWRRLSWILSSSIWPSLTHWNRVTNIYASVILAVIRSDNGLSPDRRQAIICIKVAYCYLDIWKQISVQFEPKSNNFLQENVFENIVCKMVAIINVLCHRWFRWWLSHLLCHYSNRCWRIVIWTPNDILQWNLNENMWIFNQANSCNRIWWLYISTLVEVIQTISSANWPLGSGIIVPFKWPGNHTYLGLKNNWAMQSKNGIQNLWGNILFFILC